jgi:hypothetical protein
VESTMQRCKRCWSGCSYCSCRPRSWRTQRQLIAEISTTWKSCRRMKRNPKQLILEKSTTMRCGYRRNRTSRQQIKETEISLTYNEAVSCFYHCVSNTMRVNYDEGDNVNSRKAPFLISATHKKWRFSGKRRTLKEFYQQIDHKAIDKARLVPI